MFRNKKFVSVLAFLLVLVLAVPSVIMVAPTTPVSADGEVDAGETGGSGSATDEWEYSNSRSGYLMFLYKAPYDWQTTIEDIFCTRLTAETFNVLGATNVYGRRQGQSFDAYMQKRDVHSGISHIKYKVDTGSYSGGTWYSNYVGAPIPSSYDGHDTTDSGSYSYYTDSTHTGFSSNKSFFRYASESFMRYDTGWYETVYSYLQNTKNAQAILVSDLPIDASIVVGDSYTKSGGVVDKTLYKKANVATSEDSNGIKLITFSDFESKATALFKDYAKSHPDADVETTGLSFKANFNDNASKNADFLNQFSAIMETSEGRDKVLALFDDEYDREVSDLDKDDTFYLVVATVTIPKKVKHRTSYYSNGTTEVAIGSYCPIPGMVASTKNIWSVNSAGAFDNGRTTNVTSTSLGGGAKAYQLATDNTHTAVGNFFSFVISANNALYQKTVSYGKSDDGEWLQKQASFEPFEAYAGDKAAGLKSAWSFLVNNSTNLDANIDYIPVSTGSSYPKSHYTMKFWNGTKNKVKQKDSSGKWIEASPCYGMGYGVFGPLGGEASDDNAYHVNNIIHYDIKEDKNGSLKWAASSTMVTIPASVSSSEPWTLAYHRDTAAKGDNPSLSTAYSKVEGGALGGDSYWKQILEDGKVLYAMEGSMTDSTAPYTWNNRVYGQYGSWGISRDMLKRVYDGDHGYFPTVQFTEKTPESSEHTKGKLVNANLDMSSLKQAQNLDVTKNSLTYYADLLIDETSQHRVDGEGILASLANVYTASSEYAINDFALRVGNIKMRNFSYQNTSINNHSSSYWTADFDPSKKNTTYTYTSLHENANCEALADDAKLNISKFKYKMNGNWYKDSSLGGHTGIVASLPMPVAKTTLHKVELEVEGEGTDKVITDVITSTLGSVNYKVDKASQYPSSLRGGETRTPDTIIYVPTGYQFTDEDIINNLMNKNYYSAYDKAGNYGTANKGFASRENWQLGYSYLIVDEENHSGMNDKYFGYEIYEIYHKDVESVKTDFTLTENYLADGTQIGSPSKSLRLSGWCDITLVSGNEGKKINDYFYTRTLVSSDYSNKHTGNTIPGGLYDTVYLRMAPVLVRAHFSAEKQTNGEVANFVVPVVSSISQPAKAYDSGENYAFYVSSSTLSPYGLTLGYKPTGSIGGSSATLTHTYKDKFVFKTSGTSAGMYNDAGAKKDVVNWNVNYTVKTYIPGVKSTGAATTFHDGNEHVVNGKKVWEYYPEVKMKLTYGGTDYDRVSKSFDSDYMIHKDWDYQARLDYMKEYSSKFSYSIIDRQSQIARDEPAGISGSYRTSWWGQQYRETNYNTVELLTIGLRKRSTLSSYFIKGLYNVTNQALPDRAGVLMSDTMVVKSGSLPQIYAGSDITLSVKGDAASSAVKVDADFYCLSPLDVNDSKIHGRNLYGVISSGHEFELSDSDQVTYDILFEKDEQTWNDDISGNETSDANDFYEDKELRWYKDHAQGTWSSDEMFSNASYIREWNGGGSPIDILEDDIEEVVGVEARIDKAEVVLHLDYSGSTADKDIRFPVDINMPTEDEPPVTITWADEVWQINDGTISDKYGLPSGISRWNIGQAVKNSCENGTSYMHWYNEHVYTLGIRKCHVKAESGNKVGDLMIEDKIPYSYMPAKGETAKGTWKFNAYDSDGNLLITFGIKNADFQLIYGTNEDL